MAITAKDVMELRKQTDCGMMECKKALTEADGNFEKAIEILRERGLANPPKKPRDDQRGCRGHGLR